MKPDKYERMTETELLDLARQRTKETGIFKKAAIMAQWELWKRFHWTDNVRTVDDGFQERPIEDIEYNG